MVPLWRLYLLRATYLLIAVGLGAMIWPQLLGHPETGSLMRSVALSLLGAMTLLSLLGLRYPLQMLPLLIFEMVWKIIWLTRVAWPLWAAHQMTPDFWETTRACLMSVIFPIVIPWRYVIANYMGKPAERWR